MALPVFTLTDAQNNPVSVMNFGVVDAGNASLGFSVRIWNNQQGASNIPNALNTTLTTKTLNGFDSGDSIENGNEVVGNQMIQVQCTTMGETAYTPIGGPITHPIGDSPQAGNVAPGIASGSFAACLLRANIPQTASAGNTAFLIRINYKFS